MHGLGGGRLDRGATGDDGAQEPARAVDADETGGHEDGAAVGAGLRHPGQQLLAELARQHLGGAAGSTMLAAISLRMSIQTPSVRGAANAWSCDRRLADDGGHAGDLLLLLVDLEAQLHALLPRSQMAPRLR